MAIHSVWSERAAVRPGAAIRRIAAIPEVDRQQGGIGNLQIGDESGRDDGLSKSSEGQVADHHGGNGDAQAIGRVQGRSAGIMEEHRLNTEFHSRQAKPRH